MSVMLESGAADHQHEGGAIRAIAVSPLDADLLDATLRLVRLLESPDDYQALAPLIQREIVYRLLKGPQGAGLRHLTTFGGRGHRMARAVETLRRSFTQPLRMEDLATELSVSVSGFHAHFKAATAMTPLQFQKQLRLEEARRLMLSEEKGAAEVAFEVGYDDASHFNRDYKRHFGEPPLRHIQRLKESAASP
jgi:transcriptional regulator GlxA family with amidase domain